MTLSIEKSLVIHYGTNNPSYRYYCEKKELPSSVTFVDLGVVRCSDATYCEQVATFVQKVRRFAELYSRFLSCQNADFMLREYKTYVQPIMLYAFVIWSPHLRGEVEDLEAVQRRFSKKIVGNKNLTYGQRLDSQQLLSLEFA